MSLTSKSSSELGNYVYLFKDFGVFFVKVAEETKRRHQWSLTDNSRVQQRTDNRPTDNHNPLDRLQITDKLLLVTGNLRLMGSVRDSLHPTDRDIVRGHLLITHRLQKIHRRVEIECLGCQLEVLRQRKEVG